VELIDGKNTASAAAPALSVLHVARRLLVSEGTVLRRIKGDELKAHRVGRQWRVFLSDLDDYLARNSNHQSPAVPTIEVSA